MRLRSRSTILLLALLLFFNLNIRALASQTNGTIDENYSYAWGENIGWINLAPTNSSGDYVGVTITDSGLSGYGWSSKYGWINFNPSSSGQNVTNTSAGSLGGSAWVSGLGWLDLSGISIGSDGTLTGTAGTAGTTVGRVSFDCSNCDVRTDWRPASARTSTPIAGSGFLSPISSGLNNLWSNISFPWSNRVPSTGDGKAASQSRSDFSASSGTTTPDKPLVPRKIVPEDGIKQKINFSLLDYRSSFRLFWLIIILLCTFALWLLYRSRYNK